MKRLIDFLKEWNESYLVIGLIAFWPFCAIIIRLIDPTAGVFDAGLLHALYVTSLIFGYLHLFIWVGIRLNFLFLWEYFQKQIIEDFTSCSPWQRLLMSFCYLSLYLGLVTLITIQFI